MIDGIDRYFFAIAGFSVGGWLFSAANFLFFGLIQQKTEKDNGNESQCYKQESRFRFHTGWFRVYEISGIQYPAVQQKVKILLNNRSPVPVWFGVSPSIRIAGCAVGVQILLREWHPAWFYR